MEAKFIFILFYYQNWKHRINRMCFPEDNLYSEIENEHLWIQNQERWETYWMLSDMLVQCSAVLKTHCTKHLYLQTIKSAPSKLKWK